MGDALDQTDSDKLGGGLPAGADHYRAYVGPPRDYDYIAALTTGLLFAAGLREHHTLLDLGCGSLRTGRLLIPYLLEGHYFGIEPNRWLVEDGIAQELGHDLVSLKRPTFRYVEDFSADGFDINFDYVVAQSIFSHTYPDLVTQGLRGVARGLAPTGLLLATLAVGEEPASGSGWLYPECVPYPWPWFRSAAKEAGLVAPAPAVAASTADLVCGRPAVCSGRDRESARATSATDAALNNNGKPKAAALSAHSPGLPSGRHVSPTMSMGPL